MIRYEDSRERSAEYLRQALALMGQHPAAFTPTAYALWYAYVAGADRALRNAVDEWLNSGKLIDDAAAADIYERNVAHAAEVTALRTSAGVERVLNEITQSAARTSEDAARFGEQLQVFGNTAATESPELRVEIAAILRDTQQMRLSVGGLQQRLDESKREIDELRTELNSVRERAEVDGLTGLLNRSAFDERLHALIREAECGGAHPSLVLIDVDHFKHINDQFGHVFGDRVLAELGKVLKATVKGDDTAARYGGEEFVLLLPATPLGGALVVAEQARSRMRHSRIRRGAEIIGNVTVSAGVAAYVTGEGTAKFIERADAALYESKHNGRDRVTAASPHTGSGSRESA